VNHAPAILAAPAVYYIHGRIIHQARGCQTIQTVNEKQAPPPSTVELIKLLMWYNKTVFPVDYKGENGQQ